MTYSRSRLRGFVALWALSLPFATSCDQTTEPHAARTSDHTGDDHADHDHAGHDHGDSPILAELKKTPPFPTRPEEWCYEHGVPEAVCARCNPSLIAEFKQKRDWCGGHGRPESQCILCNPEVESYWAAMKPIEPADSKASTIDLPASGIAIERGAHPLRPTNNPLCAVESNQIRFADGSIARKAGIEVEPVQRRRILATIEAPAEIRFDQTRFARITPKVAGVIAEVPVSLGDAVTAGQTIAVIESADLGQAKSTYVQARESWLMAKADMHRHHKIHEPVEALLAACLEPISDAELRQRFANARIGEHKSHILNARAQLDLARKQFEREKSLLEGGITTKDAFQTAERNLIQAETEFAAAKESVDLELESEHQRLARGLNMAQIEMDAARRHLQILGIDEQQIAALDEGRGIALSTYELKSPIDGRIVERSAVAGESVTNTEAIFAIADLKTLWLVVNLAEADLPLVDVGDRAVFQSIALRGQSVEGKIDWISDAIDDRTRTVQARSTLRNEDGARLLRPNMFGQARIIAEEGSDLLSVPASAVQTDGCCNLVFVQESETLFRPKKITLGAGAGGYVHVPTGLAEGEKVVTAGSFLLKTEILKSSIGAGCCEVDPGR